MLELADIFQAYGPAYEAKYGERMPQPQPPGRAMGYRPLPHAPDGGRGVLV